MLGSFFPSFSVSDKDGGEDDGALDHDPENDFDGCHTHGGSFRCRFPQYDPNVLNYSTNLFGVLNYLPARIR